MEDKHSSKKTRTILSVDLSRRPDLRSRLEKIAERTPGGNISDVARLCLEKGLPLVRAPRRRPQPALAS